MRKLAEDLNGSTPRKTIYVIEDEEAVARLVMRSFAEFGFAVEWFRDGGSVLRRLKVQRPDLCIVDLGLPDMDGIDLVRQIGQQSECGLLILTGRAHMIDRVMGLELGGDDYVVKPFESRELVARVRSILRRRGASHQPSDRLRYAQFAGWTFDCSANTLSGPDGAEHVLGVAETKVLRAFMQRPHQILNREQLLDQRELSPTDRTIDVRISRIRRKLEIDAQNPKIIKTVYGAGYMLMAVVTWC
jgi:two-component system OmpR family response regulator